jgi:hypothetical protein
MIKVILAVLLLAAPALAQDQAAVYAAAGCGPDSVKFDVKMDSPPHPAAQPDSGKALVYAFEDFPRGGNTAGGITTKFGFDGAWVGANQPDTYFSFSVDPGDHRLCTSWQSRWATLSRLHAAASLTAEAGKIYYFRTVIIAGVDRLPEVELEPVDPAEALILLANFSLSTSHPKK